VRVHVASSEGPVRRGSHERGGTPWSACPSGRTSTSCRPGSTA